MKKWTPLVSWHIFFYTNGVKNRWLLVSIHHLFHVEHMCSVAHVSNRLRFDTFFTFILSFENGISNDWPALPSKSRHILDKNSQTTMIWCNYKINNLLITLSTNANVLQNCSSSQKVFLKISQISCFSVGSAEYLRIPFF